MMLGDLIARFGDDAVVADAILSLGDLRLVAEMRTRAEAEGVGLATFAARAVQRYADAPDDEWITLVGELARSSSIQVLVGCQRGGQ